MSHNPGDAATTAREQETEQTQTPSAEQNAQGAQPANADQQTGNAPPASADRQAETAQLGGADHQAEHAHAAGTDNQAQAGQTSEVNSQVEAAPSSETLPPEQRATWPATLPTPQPTGDQDEGVASSANVDATTPAQDASKEQFEPRPDVSDQDYKELVPKLLALFNNNREQLGRALGLHRSTVDRWLNGKSRPNTSTILRMRRLAQERNIE